MRTMKENARYRIKCFLILLVVSFLLHHFTFSQSLEENKRKYTNAKELYKLGKYSLAMEAFKQVIPEKPNNPYPQYASYFYILSAVKEGRLTEAMLMASQLENKYPTWNKMDELRYLASDINFRQKKYKEAFGYLNKIGKDISPKEINALAINHLTKINSLDSLKQLHKTFPDNKYIGEVLANKLQAQSSSPQDEELMKKLVKEFKLDTALFASSIKFQSKKKAIYNIAILFPFMIEELNPEHKNRNNFYAIDMYEGIKLGVEALAKQGIKISIHSYDVGKDNQKLPEVLAKTELKGMDLIIGPLSNTPLPSLNNFLSANGIFGVNPVGNNPSIASNPLLYLSEPTLETQGKNTAEFIHLNFAPKKIAVFYGNTPKDSTLAHHYHAYLKEKGSKVVAFNKVSKWNVSSLTSILSDSLNYDIENVFLSTTEQTIAANFVSEIEKNGYKIPVVGSPQWLQYPFFNLDQFERINLLFIYPNFIDYSLQPVIEFRKNYKKTVNIIPSEFSYMGYDLIQYFGNALWQFGTNFQQNISAKGFSRGITTPGYDFTYGNSNNFIPLVKFEGEDFKVVNFPIR